MGATILPYAVQRKEALQKANAVRKGRRELRDELRAIDRPEAALRLAGLVESPPSYLHSMLVWDLLRGLWLRGHSEHLSSKAKALMRSSGIDPWAVVGRLTPRQRSVLADKLRALGAAR